MTNVQKGIAICLFSTFWIVLQDSLSKHLLQTFSVWQILFVRHIGFTVFAWWWGMRAENNPAALFHLLARARSPWMQILRSLLMIAEIAAFYAGLRYVGVAKAHAVFMLFPILTTLGAIVILREEVGLKVFVALALGFAGAMLIIRPGSGVFAVESLWIVLGAALFALYHVVTRFSTVKDGFRVSMAYMATVGLAITAVPGIETWIMPDSLLQGFLLLLLTGSGVLVHLLIVKSLEYAPASVLQPYNYALVGWAALLGWLIYGELLDQFDYAGILLILGGGLLMMGVIRWPFKRGGAAADADKRR